MKNIRFGIEIELIGSRESASYIVADYFGQHDSVRYLGGTYRTWEAKDSKGRKWRFMYDGSVGNGGNSCEVVSPLLDYEDIEDLQEIVRQLRHAGLRKDSSCGIHIHIDNDGMNARQIKNLVNLVSGHEELILKALQVRENGREHWCKKTDERFKARLNRTQNLTIEKVKKVWYRTQSGCDDNSDVHYDHSRYHLLNLHSMWQGKGIEFRCFNGTMHAGEIKAYIQFCLGLTARAKAVKWVKQSRREFNDEMWGMENLLYDLGLVGDEFKTCRHHMRKHLTHGSLNVA